MQKFIIFSCGYNCEKYVEDHIRSIKDQDYKNYVHIIVDDASTDATYEEILEAAKDDNRIKIIRNDKNIGWLHNSVRYLTPAISDDEDIIVQLDLDDLLARNDVLSILNKIYEEEQCWFTYGHWRCLDGRKGGTPKAKYPLNRAKDRKWFFQHLQTFKAFLWHAIDKEDLKGPNGEYATFTQDRAIYYPISEMTPPSKARFIDKVLYIYNAEHGVAEGNRLNTPEGRRNRAKEIFYKEWFRNKKPYKILEREK